MDKENKVFWRVKMQDELDLAASELDPAKAAAHRQRAAEFKSLADQDCPPDAPLNPQLP
jgi:hypothetical protein